MPTGSRGRARPSSARQASSTAASVIMAPWPRSTRCRPSSRARRRPAGAAGSPAIVVAALVLALVLFVIYLLAYTNWLWFGEIGLRVVFWRQIWSRLIVGVAAGAIFFAIFYANVEIARRLSPRHRAFEGIDVVEYVNERTVQGLRRGGLIVSLVIAVIVGAGASADWLLFQRALNGVPFHASDPIFHHDIGFYVFTLPAWQAVYGLVMGALIAGLVAAVIIHGALGGPRAAPAASGLRPRAARAGDTRPLRSRRPVRAWPRPGQRELRRQTAQPVDRPSVGAARDHLRAGRFGLHLQGLGSAVLDGRRGRRRGLHRHSRRPARHAHHDGHRLGAGRPAHRQRLLAAALALAAVRHRRLGRCADRRPGHLPGSRADARRQPQPAGQGEPVHRLQHRRHAGRLRARTRSARPSIR